MLRRWHECVSLSISKKGRQECRHLDSYLTMVVMNLTIDMAVTTMHQDAGVVIAEKELGAEGEVAGPSLLQTLFIQDSAS